MKIDIVKIWMRIWREKVEKEEEGEKREQRKEGKRKVGPQILGKYTKKTPKFSFFPKIQLLS